MESGDLSPLGPLTLRDLVWLKVCRHLKDKREWELEKKRLEITLEHEKQKQLLLMDIRQIAFWNLGYGRDQQSAADNAWYSLPSMIANGVKKETHIGVSRYEEKHKLDKKTAQ